MTDARAPERRQLTVLMCDIVGSTPLALRLDPEELADVIQAYRQRCSVVVQRHDGVVARWIGDGMLAYFGYPRAHENDAERAIRTALDLAAEPWAQATGASFDVHIGIATGLVVVGDMPDGGESLAVIGTAPNLASRLQGVAAAGQVVIAESTWRLAGRLFDYEALGPQELKGFDAPVDAWRVRRARESGSRFHALRGRARTPLVDRVAELEMFRGFWADVTRGDGRAVLVVAEPGVGKSRLAEAVATDVVDDVSLRVWYHCFPDMQGTPLAPVIRQYGIAAGFAERDDDATRLAKLEALIPRDSPRAGEIVSLLAALLGVDTAGRYPPSDMSPQRQKRRLFEILMHSLEAFARHGPLYLVVEDLHWIDPTSDELIGVLIDHLERLPILVVLTARPEFQSHWADKQRLRHVSLAPLDRDHTVAMIHAIGGESPLPERAVLAIADRADGVPLFVEDLTRDVLEGSPDAVPATLHDALMSRLDRLGSARSVAEIASVIGREFSYALLAQVCDLPEERLRDELARLVDAGLLESSRSTAVRGYAFRHALVRDAAYSSLLRKRQAALHARVAQAMADTFPEVAETQPELLAGHLEKAGDASAAATLLTRAARLAARRSGFVEAIGHAERALRLLAPLPASADRTRLELAIQRALGGIYAEYRGFASDDCGAAYAAALEHCHALGNPPEIFAVLSGLGAYEITRAHFAACRALAAECLERAATQPAKPPFIMGHLLLGGTWFLQGELAAARDHLEEAIALYDADPAPKRQQMLYVQDQKATGLSYLALVRTIAGDREGGVRAAEQGLAHARSLRGPHTINYALCYLAAVLHIAGDVAQALARASESLEVAREQGFATWVGISQAVRGASLVKQGQVDAGVAEIERGLQAHAATGAVAYQPFALTLLGEGLLATGHGDEALATLDRARALGEATGERFYLAEALRIRAAALAAMGDAAGATDCLRTGLALADTQGARLFAERCRRALGGA